MLARLPALSLLLLSAFSILAAAIPNKRGGTTSATHIAPTTTVTVTAPAPTVTTFDQCNTGSIQCCDVVTTAGGPLGQTILGLLGIVVSDLDVLLGAHCSPLSIVGVLSGETCAATPICCENNSIGGLINIGCIVIRL